ncbi:MAG: hypothetical protein UZ05_CHB002002947 [Chlorobi bacterium OLB5]|nr:MAG: hypothetical protein UZ05_CHB002002947 [Chlorobi bacterium OLB5]
MNTGKTGKILFLLFGLILVGAFSAFLVNKNMQDPKTHPPVMTFKEEKVNLGDVPQGPVVNGEFEFTNTGQSVLIIKKISAACGCTGLVADEKKEYQPGESGKLKFTFNTEGRSGVNEKSISIETNHPTQPNKMVTFTANIIVPQPNK